MMFDEMVKQSYYNQPPRKFRCRLYYGDVSAFGKIVEGLWRWYDAERATVLVWYSDTVDPAKTWWDHSPESVEMPASTFFNLPKFKDLGIADIPPNPNMGMSTTP